MADFIELAEEQKFFDHAYELREQYRETIQHAPEAAAHKGAAAGIKRITDAAIEQIGPPDEAVAFGRMDHDAEFVDTLYIGRYPVWNGSDVIVASWKSDAGRRFQEATLANPMGLTRRRIFTTEANTITDFEEQLFIEIAIELAELEDRFLTPDSLLRDLDRHRTGEMQDIVKTIQAEQSHIMREEIDQALVIQGGPGTGKTVIGLHRASWILYQTKGRFNAADLLIVGPSRTFVRYISKVLPELGDRNVTQVPLSALAPEVRVGGSDTVEVAHLKGDLRMRGLVDRALMDRITEPSAPVVFTAVGRRRTVPADRIQEALPRLRTMSYADGRRTLRETIRIAAGLGPTEGGAALDDAIEPIWPQLTPQSFLRELWGSRIRLLTSGGSEFSAEEINSLYRQRAERIAEEVWTPSDLPILDYAEGRITGSAGKRYAHIIVDEAQDLSPMQLESIARRSVSGAYTLIGDLAQSTGPWARDTWDDILEIVRKDLPSKVVELENGYRVPKQIFEFAARLLPWSAPAIRAPRAVRTGTSEPELIPVDDNSRGPAIVRTAQTYAGHGLSVGIICPDSILDEIRQALVAEDMNWTDVGRDEEVGSAITLVPANDAKGLEFEAVIVVEPEEIAKLDARGLRLLYVALTRTTKHLAVVHSGAPLPIEGSMPLPVEASARSIGPNAEVPIRVIEPGPVGRPATRIVQLIADDLASQIRGAVSEDAWNEVIAELSFRLTPRADE